MVRKSASVKKVTQPSSRNGVKSKKSQETRAADSSQKIKSKLNRLEKQLFQREAELQRVNSVQEKLASRLDFQSIIELVANEMRAITKASSLFIALSDTTSKIVSWPYCVNNNERIASPSEPLIRNITRSLFFAAKPLNLGTEQEILAYGAIPQEGSRVGKSFLGIPFTVGNAMLGVVSIHDTDHEHAFTAAEERLLQTLANAMGVALEKARLFVETRRLFKARQQRNLELQVINSVQEGLASKLEMKAIYQLVGEKISEIFTADTTFIATYEHGHQYVEPQYYVEKGQAHVLHEPLLFGAGLYSQVIQSRQSLLVGTTEEQQQLGSVSIPSPDSDEDLNQSFLGVPILLSEKVTGVVSVQSYLQNAYTENDVRLLATIANSMSVALENARLFDETQQRNAELAIVNSVQAGLASKLDMQSIYELVGEKIRSIFDTQGVTIATYDPVTNLLYFRYSIQEGERITYEPAALGDKGFRAHIIRTGQPLRLDDVEAQGTPYGLIKLQPINAPASSKSDAPKSWLGVPLLVGTEAHGVVNLYNVDRTHAYSDSDVRLLQTLVNSMSVALENARLFDETQHLLKETEQRAAELAIINSVQQALASKLDMQVICDLVGDKIRGIFAADVVGIGFYNRELGVMTYPYLVDHGKRYFPDPAPISDKHLNYMQATGTVLIDTYEQASQLMSKWGIQNVGGPMPDNSYIAVPLSISNQFMGRITVAKLPSHAFDESDVRLLQTLANSMSVALENARLFDETQRLLRETEQRAEELATVNAVGTALAGELDLSALIELVGEQVRSVFKADIAFVALLDKENHMINFPYQYGERHEPIQWGQGLTSKIIQSGQPLLINQDMDRQRRQMGVTLIGKGAQSFLGVPVFVGGESIGVVSVQSTKQEGLFSENDQRLLSTIAANVGIAFQNARLFDETQRLFQAERRAHAQTETLRSVAQALNRSLSLMEVFNLVLTEIQKVIPYDSAGVYQVHENRRVFVTGRGFSNLQDLVGVSFEFNQHEDEIGYLISQSLQPLILADASESYPQYFSTGSHAVTKIHSYMAVPIVLNQKLIGMITLGREQPGFYTDGHAGLAMAFAAQAATAIENARLWEQEKLFRKALERELEIGREIQAGFLPEALPQVEGWEIAASLMSAREVAGDFYDAFELPNGKIGLVIADVCDKGVGAALFMTLFRSLIRITSNREYFEHNGNSNTSLSIATRLQHSMTLTNNYIAETHKGSGMFATVFFGILDPQEGSLIYINGGHEAPLIIHSGQVRESLRKTGPAVGAIWDACFEVRAAQLDLDETLFAFTDGAPEAKDPPGQFFGRHRLVDLLRGHTGSAQELIKHIEDELHHYMDSATQFDDITLLAVRRGPAR
jgi:GAF domain-containing protein